MLKIFEKANDQHIRQVVFYGKAADHKLYHDSACTTGKEVKQAELEEAVRINSLVIMDSTTVRYPIAVAANKVKTVDVASNVVTVTEWTTTATPAG